MQKSFLLVLFLLIIVLSSSLSLADKKEKQEICPSNSNFIAKLEKDGRGRQQLFISQNKGKDFFRATWDYERQIVFLKWSPDGKYLVIADSFTPIGKPLPKITEKHFCLGRKRLIVYDPSTKMMYRIPAFPVTDVRNVKWTGDHTLSFDFVFVDARHYEEGKEELEITQQLLDGCIKDCSAYLADFGQRLLGEVKKVKGQNWEEVERLLVLFYPDEQSRIFDYIKREIKSMKEAYFDVWTDGKGDPRLTIILPYLDEEGKVEEYDPSEDEEEAGFPYGEIGIGCQFISSEEIRLVIKALYI